MERDEAADFDAEPGVKTIRVFVVADRPEFAVGAANFGDTVLGDTAFQLPRVPVESAA